MTVYFVSVSRVLSTRHKIRLSVVFESLGQYIDSAVGDEQCVFELSR